MQAQKRRDNLRIKDSEHDLFVTIFQYEKLLRSYLANIEGEGEFGAMREMKSELLAFRASEQYTDCTMH
ncbi:hypothetical protein ISG33_15320 [Glaciecola sp. MH2013]|uniref:hypothetical protein n=1 Tax=Glaciecola sp. MH2013 TaxID=2785524 RepID=UPI00189CAE43|nr:hypothetical protein [Glaciecola sp. MH2013]MBF7074771.1 hypothetical protein [Glaciecola sp. MH2013]